MYIQKNKFLFPIILLILLLTAYFFVTRQNKLNKQSITNGVPIKEVSLTPVSLDDLCHCNILLSDGTQIQVLDPVTNIRTVTVASAGNGEGGGSPAFIAVSPTGRQTLLSDTIHHQLLLVDNTTGKTKSALSIASDQFVAAWTWSPDESAIMLVFNRQLSSGVVPTISGDVVVWTAEQHHTLTTQANTDSGMSLTLLSISNDTSDAIIGWATGKEIFLNHYHNTKKTQKINSPLLQQNINSRNSSPILSGISDGHALLAINNQILAIDVRTENISVLSLDSWSGFPLSPMSGNGGAVLYLQKVSGTAHGQIMRYIPSQQTSVEQLTPYENGDGFQTVFWLPSGRFLAVRDVYRHQWLALDVSIPNKPPLLITLPGTQENETIIGFIQSRPTTAQESILFDYGQPNLTSEAQSSLDKQITNWSLYTPDTKVQIGDNSCGHPEAAKQLAQLDASGKRSLLLNDGLLVTITPNIFNWTLSQLKNFGNDVLCGVGTTAPQAIVDGNIVWWNTCVGGAGIGQPGDPYFDQSIRCVQAEDVIQRHFSVQ